MMSTSQYAIRWPEIDAFIASRPNIPRVIDFVYKHVTTAHDVLEMIEIACLNHSMHKTLEAIAARRVSKKLPVPVPLNLYHSVKECSDRSTYSYRKRIVKYYNDMYLVANVACRVAWTDDRLYIADMTRWHETAFTVEAFDPQIKSSTIIAVECL